MPDTLIYHLFVARRVHHNPRKVRYFDGLSRPGLDNRFVVYHAVPEQHVEYLSNVGDPQRIHFLKNRWQLFWYLLTRIWRRETYVLHGFADVFFGVSWITRPIRRAQYKWICWGPGVSLGRGWSGHVQRWIKRWIYSSVDRIGCLMEEDRQRLESFGVRAPLDLVKYDPPEDMTAARVNCDPYFDDHLTTVMVGIHAAPVNRHLELFDRLSRSGNESIRVIAFLNYSITDPDYVSRVKARGRELFGDRFVSFDELLDIRLYWRVLKSVDLLIVPQTGQAGLGAINCALLNEAVVLLAEDGFNRKWLERLGVHTGTLTDLDQYPSVDALLQQWSSTVRHESKRQIEKFLDPEVMRQEWIHFLTA